MGKIKSAFREAENGKFLVQMGFARLLPKYLRFRGYLWSKEGFRSGELDFLPVLSSAHRVTYFSGEVKDTSSQQSKVKSGGQRGETFLCFMENVCFTRECTSWKRTPKPRNGWPRNLKGEMLGVGEQSNKVQVCSVTDSSVCETFLDIWKSI